MRNLINYCDNCRIACNESICPNCGKKKLRPVDDGDFCFVTEANNSVLAYYCGELESKGVECVNMPWFSALDTYLAVKSSSGRLFVRFKDLDTAIKTVQEYKDEITANLKKHILDNFEKVTISYDIEKRAKKRLGLSKNSNIYDICFDIVESAQSIFDTGIADDLEGGHVLCALSGNQKIYINSVTYNVIDLGKR